MNIRYCFFLIATILISTAQAQDIAWEQKFEDLNQADSKQAHSLGLELVLLPPEEGFVLLDTHWERVTAAESRRSFLQAWFYGTGLDNPKHPRLLDVLNLGMNDSSPLVQEGALSWLKMIALKDFSNDFSAYKKWYKANRQQPPEEVIGQSISALIGRKAGRKNVSQAEGVELLQRAWRSISRMPGLKDRAMEAGLLDCLEVWAKAQDEKVARHALQLIRELNLDEIFHKRVTLPLTSPDQSKVVRDCAVSALKGQTWALDWLLNLLEQLVLKETDVKGIIREAAEAIASIDDPSAIPHLIGLIDADNTYATVYGIGYMGLKKLTGVDYDEAHDGSWWRAWWEKNKARYPESVQQLEVPTFAPTERKPLKTDLAEEEIPSRELLAGKDKHKNFFLIGEDPEAKPPAEGYGLFIILPGGNGSRDFHPFVKRIYQHGLPEGYLAAQPVAIKWDESQQIVWPTEKHKVKNMKFSTEEFVEAVIKEVKKQQKVDPERIFTLSWSSSGPAAYAISLQKKTAVTGSFIAMSVFKPDYLPSLRQAKGRAFYLYHSEEDQVCPFRMAEEAKEKLEKAKARVEFATYAGGHGWRGDVYGSIRKGVAWLEKNHGQAGR